MIIEYSKEELLNLKALLRKYVDMLEESPFKQELQPQVHKQIEKIEKVLKLK